jgi:plastocyanin
MRRLIALLLLTFTLAACKYGAPNTTLSAGSGYVPGSTMANVSVSGYAFSPDTLTIPVGVTVTWMNNDPVAHTVTSSAMAPVFDSMDVQPGAAFSFTFTTAGTFPYRCTIHAGMNGTVTVTP